MAIKILTTEQSKNSKTPHELLIFMHISTAEGKKHERCAYLRDLSDYFNIPSHNGLHTCLIHTPLRESASTLRKRFLQRKEGPLPGAAIKQVVLCVLIALDHLHDNCNIVHTGES